MGKLHLKKYLLLLSGVLLFTNCGYKFLAVKGKALFIMPVENSTLNPQLDMYADSAVKQVFIEQPHFVLAPSREEADIILKINIKKTDRQPLFFSRQDSSEIVSAKFHMEADIELFKDGMKILQETVSDNFAFSLSGAYKEEEVMSRVARYFADSIYFWMADKNEKGLF